jgi:multicomponent Na+:H+ antiporter subunit D
MCLWESINNLLPLFIALPLAMAFLISLLGKKRKYLGDALAVSTTFVLFLFSLLPLIYKVLNQTLVYKVGSWPPPLGISLVLDGLSGLMLVVVNLVAFLVSIYSISYMKLYTDKWKFYTLFLLMLAGMNGVILSGDMFNLYVFLEISAVASYALVAFGTEEEELEAGFKYSVMGIVASSFILLGIALLYSFTSTLNMADMAQVLAQKSSTNLILFVSVLFIMGFGLKSALVPFHAWLPDAHPSAPAPISALLSGVLIKVLGVYAILRVFYSVLGVTSTFSNILIYLGIVSMLMGAFLAIAQFDIKRMLAYSSISQVGLIILGFGIGTPLAIVGSLFHLVNHSLFKSLLFLNAGGIEYSLQTRDLRKMGGLNAVMPATGFSSLMGSLSIAGIPPLAGFWSKLLIVLGAVKAERFWTAGLIVLASIITLGYYLKLQKFAFFGEGEEKDRKIRSIPLSMNSVMVILAILSLIGGLVLISAPLSNLLDSAKDVLLNGIEYANSVFEAVK